MTKSTHDDPSRSRGRTSLQAPGGTLHDLASSSGHCPTTPLRIQISTEDATTSRQCCGSWTERTIPLLGRLSEQLETLPSRLVDITVIVTILIAHHRNHHRRHYHHDHITIT